MKLQTIPSHVLVGGPLFGCAFYPFAVRRPFQSYDGAYGGQMIFCYCILYVVVYWLRGYGLTGALLRCKVALCNNVLVVSLKKKFSNYKKKHFWVWGGGEKIRGEIILHALQWLPTCIGL